MGLLGGVDQEEEQGECARGDGALFDGQAVDNPKNFFECKGADLVMAPCAGCHAQTLDNGEGFVAFQPANYPPQRRGKPADVLMER